jgi:hypothetical protein
MIVLAPECSEEEWQAAKARSDQWAAGLSLPNGWIDITARVIIPDTQFEGQHAFVHRDGRRVIGSVGQQDGRWWLHVSVSREKRIPSYEDLADVKRTFVGDQLQALQIFPRAERHVNLHPHCLHLWACVETGRRRAARLRQGRDDLTRPARAVRGGKG